MYKKKYFRLNIVMCLLLLFAGVESSAIGSANVPVFSYDNFVELKKFESLEYAIKNNKFIYMPPGLYQIDNPVIIDRDKPLFLHGGDRIDTVIKPKHPLKPLFIVKNATHINISGIRISGSSRVGNRLFIFENINPLQFEVQDSLIESGVIDIKSPGTYRFQATVFNNRGISQASIIIDHPDADLFFIGGNMKSGGGEVNSVGGDDVYNIWQKQGRLRVYGTGVQRSIGRADFRIDSASFLGAHVIAYVRSEGTNGYRKNKLPSSLLFVPSSREKVDVLMMANAGQWPRDNKNINHLINYNAAGTVWMVGNTAQASANHIVTGDAKESTIIALGNRIYNGLNEPFLINAKSIYDYANTYSHSQLSGDKTYPNVRYINSRNTLKNTTEAPAIPKVILPQPLLKPTLNHAFLGMIDVKRDFGAKGDGVTDDTKALQNALISGKQIFIPEGVYRITSSLGYTHSKFGAKAMKEGGWIAGAGMRKTRIKRDYKDKGAVFSTEGMGYFTIQGISFETARYEAGDELPINESAISLEFNANFKGAFATQELIFYDCRFDGGRHAVSIGLKTGTMGSENMFIGSEFINAKYGLAIGSYNALNNIAYGSTLIDNEIVIGHDDEYNTGGTGALMNVDILGSSKKVVELKNSAGEPWYFNNVKSTTSKLFESAHSSKPYYLFFDQCEFTPANPTDKWIDSSSGGGLFFLHSTVIGGGMSINSKMSVYPVLILHSNFNDLSPRVKSNYDQ